MRTTAAGLCLATLLTGCAAPRVAMPGAAEPSPARTSEPLPASGARWNGRLALQVEDAPSQSFYASFELAGDAAAGSLALTTPIGSTAALLRWEPGRATLQRGGRAEPQSFDSLDDLAARATGTPIPVAALFDWLAGDARPVPGWIVDLSARTDGRIVATRQQPLPVATLRVVLER